MGNQSTIKKRNGNIDIMRFILCVLIVFLHGTAYLPDGVASFVRRGGLCVEFFFLVSGYLMVCTAKRTIESQSDISTGIKTAKFIKRKINSLMPMILVSAIIAFLFLTLSRNDLSVVVFIKRAIFDVWRPMLLTSFGFGYPNELWYISSMIIVMMIFYPILIKHFDTFTRVIAPLVALFCLGYLIKEYDSLVSPSKWLGIIYKGQIRAFGDLALGVAIYPAVQAFGKLKLNKFAKTLVDLFQLGGWAFVLAVMIKASSSYYDSIVLLIITVNTIFAFSHQGLTADLLDNKFSSFLGKISLAIYLSHYWLTFSFTNLYPRLSAASFLGLTGDASADSTKIWCIYLSCVFVATVIIYTVSTVLKKNSDFFGSLAKKLFLTEKG